MKRLAKLVPGGLVALVTAVLAAITRWAGPPIYCGDGWFHVRYAAILRSDGIARTFPWWQETFLATRFTDFNLLYHLLLIPFTLGNELTGARVASVVFAALAMAAFWWCLRSLGVPWPWFFALLPLAIAPEFAYRLTYTRPLVLGLALTFLGTSAILRGRGRQAFVLTFLYAHTHCSFHLLPSLALLHWGSDTFSRREKVSDPFSKVQTFSWSLGGAAAGSVLTPYFPNNVAFWWTANVEVLRTSWRSGGLLRVGTEMLPIRSDELFWAHVGVFILSGAVLFALTRVERVSAEARTLLITAGGFFVLTLLSQRFAELWAPFTVLLAGVVARDLRVDEVAMPSALGRRLAAGAALVLLLLGLRHTLRDNRSSASAEDPPRWRAAARWMKANVPAGETIFHLGWDEFPELFFEDTTHRYLIGQDATFFWVTSPSRCRLWASLARGSVEDAWGPVRETFRARWAFVPRRYRSFLRLVRRDPRFTEAWSDESAVVYRVDDDGATVAGWEIAPAGGGAPVACSTAGFVDLARAGARCARALGALDGGVSRVGITTDDEIALRVNGEVVYERAARKPRDLSAILDAPGAEVEVPVALRPGENPVEITSCRTGDDFGFILRVLEGRP